MKLSKASITRRLIASVLILELVAGIALIVTNAHHEEHVQFQALNANLRATANALLGAIQEADTQGGKIHLDRRGLLLPANAIYSVKDEKGEILGSQGDLPAIQSKSGQYVRLRIAEDSYRFFTLTGDRIIDPGVEREVDHHITVLYGLPEGHVQHAVLTEIKFFSFATLGFWASQLSYSP